MLDAYDASLEVLSSLGARIVDVRLETPFGDIAAILGKIIGAEGYARLGQLVEDADLPLDDDVRPRILIGKNMSARDYLLVLEERERIKASYRDALAGVHALLTPTTTTTAPTIESIDQSTTPAMFTRVANLLDCCALALPNGSDKNGLPVSFQIICASYQEALALRIGRAYEQATAWHKATPPGFP